MKQVKEGAAGRTVHRKNLQPDGGRIGASKGTGVCSGTGLWKDSDGEGRKGEFGGGRWERDRQTQWYVNVWVSLQGIESKSRQVTES